MIVRKYKGMDILSFYGTMEEMEKRTDKPSITECKFVRFKKKSAHNKDAHLIVLVHHFEDGSMYKELKLLTDYKRPYWTTKKVYQKYNDKKEFEHVSRLQLNLSTQSDLDENVCRTLGLRGGRYARRNLKDSPYIYGYEVPSTSLIVQHYKNVNDNYLSHYKVVNLDIEADVTGKYNDISIITLSMNGARHTAVLRRMLSKIYDSDEKMISAIRKNSEENLPDSAVKRDCKIYNVTLHDNDLDMITTIFEMLHIIRPDFVTIHNIKYDMSTILNRLEYLMKQPNPVFNDPEIPANYRMVDFNEARPYKFKKGVKQSVRFEEQWTTVDIFASFMMMDTMTGFAAIRQAAGKLVGGYGLSNILKAHNVPDKLFFEDDYTKVCSAKEKHAYLSENFPIHYITYAEQDTVAMTTLENMIEDFTDTLPIFAGIADFNRFNSSTHKAICNAYQENRPDGWIIGTTPHTTIDRDYLSTRGWIKTLPSDHIQDIGLPITNIAGLSTNVTSNADDVDCISSYPSDIQAMNISLSALVAEVVSVGDIEKSDFIANNINIVSSNAGVVEYCNKMMNMPTHYEMIEEAIKITKPSLRDNITKPSKTYEPSVRDTTIPLEGKITTVASKLPVVNTIEQKPSRDIPKLTTEEKLALL